MSITALQLINVIAMAGFLGHSLASKSAAFVLIFGVILAAQVVAVIGGGIAA